MGKRIPVRGSADRPLRRAPGSQFQQRFGRLGGEMIRQGQELVLVGPGLTSSKHSADTP